MSDPEPKSTEHETKQPLSNSTESIELSPELKELEKRLNTSMLININKCIADALKPIQDSIDKIVNSSEKIDQQEVEIRRLNVENTVLKTQVNDL